MSDLVLGKAEEFTRIEVVCLEAWLAAAQRGELQKAHNVLRTGLLAEHYRSLLHEDPQQWTSGQGTTYLDLLEQFDRALREIGDDRGTHPY